MEHQNANAADDIEELEAKLVRTNDALKQAEDQAAYGAKTTQEARKMGEAIARENQQLQRELQKAPKTVTEKKTVYMQSPPRGSYTGYGALTDTHLLAIFDEIDADNTGFAGRLELRDRVVDTKSEDGIVFELVEALKKLDVIVVERDDFKVMLAKLRGVIPQSEVAAEESKPEAAAPAASGSDPLLVLFDELDEDACGFVPKTELAAKLAAKALTDWSLAGLVASVGAVDAAIINREDFEELLQAQSGGAAPAAATTAALEASTDALDFDGYMAIFDEVDTDGVGFAQRLDLRNKIESHEGTAVIVADLQALNTVILERSDFEEMVRKL